MNVVIFLALNGMRELTGWMKQGLSPLLILFFVAGVVLGWFIKVPRQSDFDQFDGSVFDDGFSNGAESVDSDSLDSEGVAEPRPQNSAGRALLGMVAGQVGRLKQLSDGDLVRQLQRLSGSSDPMNVAMTHLLLDEFVSRDPEAALRWALDSAREDEFLGPVMDHWVRRDREAAFAAAAALDSPGARRVAVASALTALAEVSPSIAFERYLELREEGAYPWPAGIFEKWAERDPAAAVAALDRMNGQGQFFAVYSVFRTLGRKQGESFLSIAESIENPVVRQRALGTLLISIGDRDPARALELAEQYEDSGSWTLGRIYDAWASMDPDAAIHHATGSLNASEFTQVVRRISEQWALSDPDAALTFALDLQARVDRESALTGVFSSLLERDVGAALELLSTIDDPSMRAAIVAREQHKLVALDFESVLGVLESSVSGSALQTGLGGVLRELARSDPVGIRDFVMDLPPGPFRERSIDQMIGEWAGQNPNAAFEWISTLAPGPDRSALYKRSLEAFAERNPVAASEFVLQVGDPVLRSELAESIGRELAGYDPASALAWLERWPDAASFESVGLSVLREVGKVDPVSALETALALSEESTDLPQRIFPHIARRQPAIAAEYLHSLEEDTQARMASNLADSYFRQDSHAAHLWMESLEPGPVRGRAVEGLVQVMAPHDPSYAFTWADSVTDPARRVDLLRETFRNWGEFDPEAANEALRRVQGLSTADRDQLANALAEGEGRSGMGNVLFFPAIEK